MSEILRKALVLRLKQTRDCPACGTFNCHFEEFDGETFDFVAEAAYGCGSRVKVSTAGSLEVAEGCPDVLRQALDDIENDVAELLEAAS